MNITNEYLSPEEIKEYEAANKMIAELESKRWSNQIIIDNLRDGISNTNKEAFKRHCSYMLSDKRKQFIDNLTL